MKTINVNQGSDEWHAHRSTTRNASEASAVIGVRSRADLVRQYATGIAPEISESTQMLFDRGHAVEPALRDYAESVIGEDLYPMVAVSDDGYLGASFDGVTMLEDCIFEAKLSNKDKMTDVRAGVIPEADFWQVVQQFAVCETAQTCIYVCGDGTADGTVHMMISRGDIESDIPTLIAAWRQFDADVAEFRHEPITTKPVAAPVEGFGALMLRVEGKVLASNLDAFRAGADAFIGRLPKPAELQTDQDFADADAAVKACADAESRIRAAKDQALAQMADVDAVLRAADSIAETIRAARLALDKAVKTEKENRKAELVRSGVDAVREYYGAVNATLPGYELGVPASLTSDIGSAIKGLKSISSIRDKICTAVAQAKISASQEADRRRLCIAVIDQHAEHRALIPDASALVASKSPDDLRNLIAARVAQHEAREQARLEAERERIRAEEQARAQREADAKAEKERQRIRDEEQEKAREQAKLEAEEIARQESVQRSAAVADTTVRSEQAPKHNDGPTNDTGARIRLGELNAMIAPLSITADGLSQLGFEHVATEKAAKLYRSGDVGSIVAAMISHLQRVRISNSGWSA